MRKALASLAGLLGLAALARALRRRPPARPAPAAPDPADELRRRLEQARADEPAAAAQAKPGPPTEPVSLEERRARVHARAQEAIDLMREPGEGT